MCRPLVRGMRSFAAEAAMTSEGTICVIDAELGSGMLPMCGEFVGE
jgi:hypothetical protein